MGVVSLITDVPAQVGDAPRRPKLIVSDNLATLTAAGYLNQYNMQGQSIAPSDVIDAFYSYVSPSNPGTYVELLPTISNGVITLNEILNPGNVLLPVTSGDFAVFNGTAGQIKDASYSPSNAAKTKVVMANAAVVSGNLAKFADTAGTVADQGVAMKSVAGAAAAGGAAAQSFTDAFCTAGSCVVGNWNTQANAASVLKIVPGNGSFVVTSSADAGAGTFNYIITK